MREDPSFLVGPLLQTSDLHISVLCSIASQRSGLGPHQRNAGSKIGLGKVLTTTKSSMNSIKWRRLSLVEELRRPFQAIVNVFVILS